MSDRISELVVKGTLGLLIAFSIATWALVLVKAIQALRARRENARFASVFTEQSELPAADSLRSYEGPTARVAQAGVAAWESVEPSETSTEIDVPRDILERSLKRQIQKERRATESGLAVLGSIGSTSPFVGLFGTVWGIMHALKRISGAGSASLDVVAGPIGEALVATGIGIAVAVPAVLAYNFFVRRLKVQTADLEDFGNLLINAALRGSLPEARSGRSSERAVARLSDARAGSNLREARV